MELKKLTVHNYKSLVNFELKKPNAFTVFAGPNGAGKSNIFEALEFCAYKSILDIQVSIERLFGDHNSIKNFNAVHDTYSIEFEFDSFRSEIRYIGKPKEQIFFDGIAIENLWEYNLPELKTLEKEQSKISVQKHFYRNFLRIFINKNEFNRIQYTSNERLLPSAFNLESVLKRILKDEAIKEEFLEWLDLFIPGFSNIEIHSDNIGGTDTLLIYEQGTQKPFTKNLISDGTYNILALLTAVYQTNEPQFLCIEEPENGLNPYVVESLVDFFRRQCEEKGHVIWLNTHSQTLVNKLRPEELVLVDKVNGETKAKQFPKDYDLHGLEMDTAWLSNALGGGLPW